MAGIMMEPMAAVSAAVDPEIPEKKISDTMETIPNPFLKWPTKAWARLTSLIEIPPVSIKAPARIKKGTAKRGKESQPVKIFCGTMIRGMFPFIRRPRIEASPMLKAMGTLMATRATKAMLRMRPIYDPKNSKPEYRNLHSQGVKR
jgi:hypothetical protein